MHQIFLCLVALDVSFVLYRWLEMDNSKCECIKHILSLTLVVFCTVIVGGELLFGFWRHPILLPQIIVLAKCHPLWRTVPGFTNGSRAFSVGIHQLRPCTNTSKASVMLTGGSSLTCQVQDFLCVSKERSDFTIVLSLFTCEWHLSALDIKISIKALRFPMSVFVCLIRRRIFKQFFSRHKKKLCLT